MKNWKIGLIGLIRPIIFNMDSMKQKNISHSVVSRGLAVALLSVTTLLATVSCGDSVNEFSDYPCRFVFNMNTHANSAALRSAVSSVGVFCKVTQVVKGGASYYHFSTNQGLSDEVIFTAEDQRTTVSLGTNNGIWLGFGNLDTPPIFYGYDAECPNCFDPNAIPIRSKPLSVNTSGIATCNVCHREYNMNTGGNVVSGDKGSPLRRFRYAAYSAAGIVTVNN